MIDQIKAVQDAIDKALKANGHELTTRQLKAIQISKVICSFAESMARNCVRLSTRKKIFRKIDRRPIKRILRNQIRAQMALAFRMNQMQIQQIISQPIPKFPKGVSDTSYAICETGEEVFKMKS